MTTQVQLLSLALAETNSPDFSQALNRATN
jgi:hypothetical protein